MNFRDDFSPIFGIISVIHFSIYRERILHSGLKI